MIAVRLPAGIEDRLNTLARTTGRTKTHYVREALELHLGQLEREYGDDKTLRLVRVKSTHRSEPMR